VLKAGTLICVNRRRPVSVVVGSRFHCWPEPHLLNLRAEAAVSRLGLTEDNLLRNAG